MSDEIRVLLLDSLERLLREQCTPERVQEMEPHGFDAELWQQVCDLELQRAALPEQQGGVDAGLPVMVELVQLAAAAALSAPVVEMMVLAPWLAGQAGIELPEGMVTVAGWLPGLQAELVNGQLLATGILSRVPFGRFADRVWTTVALDGKSFLIDLPVDAAKLEPGSNLAAEASDQLFFERCVVDSDRHHQLPAGAQQQLAQLGALMRAAAMVGALRRAQELSHNYVSERQQFGRPLSKFQAIQQQLAMFAAELEAAAVMVGVAALEFEDSVPEQRLLSVASAKIQAGQAAGMGARIAHQVHGAMGFTQEYPLHHATRRVWSWRDDYGTESYWALRVGDQTVAATGPGLWPLLTGT